MYVKSVGAAHYLEAALRGRLAHARRDRGASVIEWVIISAVLVILVGVVGGILYTKISSAANAVNLAPAVGGP
jgi:Flp pilus assembly protein TadG